MLRRRVKFALNLFGRLFGGYKFYILLLAALGLLSGFLESIGISMLIPIFSIVVGESVLETDTLSGIIKSFFAYLVNLRPEFFVVFLKNWLGEVNYDMVWLLTLVPIFFAAKAGLSVLFAYIGTSVGTSFEFETRNRLYQKALAADWPYLLKQKIGHLENTLMLDIRMSAKLMGELISLILDLSMLAVYAVVAISISYRIAVITLSVGLAIFVIAQFFMQRTRLYTKWQTVFNKDIAHHINEHVSGIKTIKVAGAERSVADRGREFFRKVREITLRQAVVKNIFGSLVSPLSILFIIIVFAISYAQPGFNLAIFAATVYLIQRIFIHVNTAQKSIHTINDFIPYLVNVVSLENKIEKNQEQDAGVRDFSLESKLEFKDVRFSYDARTPVLKEVSFEIKRGEFIGIIGPSGAGKTTVVDLLLRLFQPQSGEILLDGVDLREIKLSEWRRNIGYVSQDIFLLNDTVAQNIKFYDESITQADTERAAKLANIYEFIGKLENGFNTVLGERGVRLSGGEKQRIALARALARKPAILILDEATSALDAESEALIQKALERLKGDVTIMAIAHRVSTILKADRLLVLQEGRVQEEGPPQELLKAKDSYFYKINKIV